MRRFVAIVTEKGKTQGRERDVEPAARPVWGGRQGGLPGKMTFEGAEGRIFSGRSRGRPSGSRTSLGRHWEVGRHRAWLGEKD